MYVFVRCILCAWYWSPKWGKEIILLFFVISASFLFYFCVVVSGPMYRRDLQNKETNFYFFFTYIYKKKKKLTAKYQFRLFSQHKAVKFCLCYLYIWTCGT